MIEFAKFSEEEALAVGKIIARARQLFGKVGMSRTDLEIRMDLSAVHEHTPLRLAELAEAGDFDFAHDIAGIYRHLNRKTGKLENCFVPRFAQRTTEEAPDVER